MRIEGRTCGTLRTDPAGASRTGALLAKVARMPFPMFLGILFGAIATAALLGYLFSRGGNAHH
jgi:hypothetical protein